MNAPLIAAYKGPAGPDVLAFCRIWARASGRPLHVVTVYPGHAPIGGCVTRPQPLHRWKVSLRAAQFAQNGASSTFGSGTTLPSPR